MSSLPIRLRLTVWYTIVLAVTVCVLGLTMYFAMRQAIVVAVDADLRQRLDGIAPFMESRIQSRHSDDLQHEFQAHLSGVKPGGELLQVGDSRGKWIYRKRLRNPY
jgi:hypothetical protein